MTTPKISPCPFCGCGAEVIETHKNYFTVLCGNEACQCRVMPEMSPLAAITVWNERAQPNVTQGMGDSSGAPNATPVSQKLPVSTKEPHEGAYKVMEQSFLEEQTQHEETKRLLAQAKAAALHWKGLWHQGPVSSDTPTVWDVARETSDANLDDLRKPDAPSDHVEAVLLEALTLLTNATIQLGPCVDQPGAPVTRIRELLRAEIEALLSEHRSGSTASGVSSDKLLDAIHEALLLLNTTEYGEPLPYEKVNTLTQLLLTAVASPVSPVSEKPETLEEKDA